MSVLRPRRLTALAALVLIGAALGGPLGAAAQSGPDELWEAFPLEPAPSSSADPAPAQPDPAPAAAAPEGGGGDGVPFALLLAGGLVIVGGLTAVGALSMRRARGHAPQPAAPAAAAPAPAPAAPARRLSPRPVAEPEARALATLAADYLEIVSRGSSRPVV